MAPSRGQDLQPDTDRRYRRTEKWMEDMRDQLCHEHDTAFREWMAVARKKRRPKMAGKKSRKAKKPGKNAKGRCAEQRFSSKQLKRNPWLREIVLEEKLVDEGYCRVMGVGNEQFKHQLVKFSELRILYNHYHDLRVEILERELFPAHQERLQRRIQNWKTTKGKVRTKKETKDAFKKLKSFIGDRIRMCKIKRLGRRQHFYSAKKAI